MSRVDTTNQIADIFTKALPAKTFHYLKSKLRFGRSSPGKEDIYSTERTSTSSGGVLK
jgi:hypothetical protein